MYEGNSCSGEISHFHKNPLVEMTMDQCLITPDGKNFQKTSCSQENQMVIVSVYDNSVCGGNAINTTETSFTDCVTLPTGAIYSSCSKPADITEEVLKEMIHYGMYGINSTSCDEPALLEMWVRNGHCMAVPQFGVSLQTTCSNDFLSTKQDSQMLDCSGKLEVTQKAACLRLEIIQMTILNSLNIM